MTETLSQRYLDGLAHCYERHGASAMWETFIDTVHGADPDDLLALKERFHYVPTSLLALLSIVDGTYWRDYGDETVKRLLLGSQGTLAYYLFSTDQMLEDADAQKLVLNVLDDLEEHPDAVQVDERLLLAPSSQWLHLADSSDHGSTSQLFIDFTPSPKGTVGQVVMWARRPDRLVVIAPDFDTYLSTLMAGGYEFLSDESAFE